jgi:hypothetical protein
LIAGSGQQARALAEVAGALGTAGQTRQANEIVHLAVRAARSINNPGDQARALAGVAGALGAASQKDRAGELARLAIQTARATIDTYEQARALAGVARALAAAGQADQAVQAARLIAGSGQRAQTMTRIEEMLATAGQADQATGPIVGPGQHDTVARATETITTGGQISSARRAAAIACGTCHWTSAVGPVLLLEPSAFAALAHVLHERWQIQLSPP